MIKLVTFGLFSAACVALGTAYAGSLSTLYNFHDKTDGANPIGGVIMDAAGNMYGETFRGGGATCTSKVKAAIGCGTVYRFNPTTGLTVLASFTGPNGAHGSTTMALVGNTLFGATEFGGSSDAGVVFSVNTDGSNFQVLHQFSGADGQNPTQVLLPGPNGVVYGVTQNGGANSGGVLYSIDVTGAYTMLHSFAQATGSLPISLTLSSDGTLFGSTRFGGKMSSGCSLGCGTTFSFKLSTGVYTLLLSFDGSGATAPGNYPYVGSVGPGPIVYGVDTTDIFSLSRPAGYANLAPVYFFTTGGGPLSGPIYTAGGTLYGIFSGSSLANNGILYSLSNNVTTDVYIWNGTRDGGVPLAPPTLTAAGSLIGTTSQWGGCTYCGTIWQYTP